MADFDHFRFLTEKNKENETMDTVFALDFFNQEAKVGDTIVYATRRSSSMDMHKAKIVDIIENYQSPYSNFALKVAKDMKYEPGWAVKETVMLTNPLFVVVKASLE